MNHEYFNSPGEADWTQRGDKATVAAKGAFDRLLRFAEESERGQGRTVCRFIASFLTVHPLDVYDLRAVDIAISDDILLCLDAVRWNRTPILDLAPNGRERSIALCRARGFLPKA